MVCIIVKLLIDFGSMIMSASLELHGAKVRSKYLWAQLRMPAHSHPMRQWPRSANSKLGLFTYCAYIQAQVQTMDSSPLTKYMCFCNCWVRPGICNFPFNY